MRRIAILASGSGTNAENIIRYFQGRSDVEIPFVLSNKKDAYVHERARQLGVPSYTYTKEAFQDGTVLQFLLSQNIDLVVLAGYMLKISDDMLAAYPNKILNIHPSLLPKFGGKGMHGDEVHKAVVAAGETESGITVHYLNDRYDEGEVIFQASCPVLPDDGYEQVAAKVHALEYAWYPKVIERELAK
ncbi:MAG: phosphoribosylglycinamide formyltransferase [Paludibacteraceae bacterium]|nr:phosphoribosylglycinamide formyltransferase [Paludibacteraceae bacterium]